MSRPVAGPPGRPTPVVVLSERTLGRVCPERLVAAGRPGGWSRLAASCRARLRLAAARAAMRWRWARGLPARLVGLRLRLRLAWMRLRHCRRLARPPRR